MDKIEKYLYKQKRLNFICLLASLIDLTLGVASIFLAQILLPAVVSSCVTGIVVCIGFGAYSKVSAIIPYAEITQKKLAQVNLQKKIYSKSNIILSALDIFFGVIAIVAIGQFVNESLKIPTFAFGINLFKASKLALNTTATTIQATKLRNFYKMGGLISVAYISTRKNHFLRSKNIMKKFIDWIKSNPRTLSAVGATITTVIYGVMEFIGQIDFGALTHAILALLGTASAGLVGWAGFETPTTAAARKEAEAQLKEKTVTEKQAEIENAKLFAQAEKELQADIERQIKERAEQLKTEIKPKLEPEIAKEIEAAAAVPPVIPQPTIPPAVPQGYI